MKSKAIEWFVRDGVMPVGGGSFKEVPCLVSRDGVHVIALNGNTTEVAKRLYLGQLGAKDNLSPAC